MQMPTQNEIWIEHAKGDDQTPKTSFVQVCERISQKGFDILGITKQRKTEKLGHGNDTGTETLIFYTVTFTDSTGVPEYSVVVVQQDIEYKKRGREPVHNVTFRATDDTKNILGWK